MPEFLLKKPLLAWLTEVITRSGRATQAEFVLYHEHFLGFDVLDTRNMLLRVELLRVLIGIYSINPELPEFWEIFGHHQEPMLGVIKVFAFIKVKRLTLLFSVDKALVETILFIFYFFPDSVKGRVVQSGVT